MTSAGRCRGQDIPDGGDVVVDSAKDVHTVVFGPDLFGAKIADVVSALVIGFDLVENEFAGAGSSLQRKGRQDAVEDEMLGFGPERRFEDGKGHQLRGHALDAFEQ